MTKAETLAHYTRQAQMAQKLEMEAQTFRFPGETDEDIILDIFDDDTLFDWMN